MKKLLLISIAAALSLSGLKAGESNYTKNEVKEDYYLQYGVSFSDSDENLVQCRGSLVAVGGYNLGEHVGVEGRYVYGLGDHYRSYGLYVKPQLGYFHALAGYGVSEYLDYNTKFQGADLGVGVTLIDKISVDVMHRLDEEATTLTVMLNHKF